MKREGVTKDKSWAAWVHLKRKACELTRRYLAGTASIDPSYMTLIERDGYVPAREVTACLGRSLGAEDEAMIMAGYVPQSVNKSDMIGWVVEGYRNTHLSANARQLVLRLKDMDKRDQEKVAPLLLSLLDGYQRNNVGRGRLKVVSA